MLQPGQRIIITSTEKVNFSEGMSENKKERFFQNYKQGYWKIFMIGESDNICVVVNEENLYVSMPIENIKSLKKIYISGPITGVHNKNIENFKMYEQKFRLLGYEVVNPQELDHSNHDQAHSSFMKVDVAALMQCDELAIMYDQPWRASDGCMDELYLASKYGIKIIDAETMEELEFHFDKFTFIYSRKA